MPETLVPVCKPSAPISVMFIHGTKDPVVHIDGGPVLRDRGVAISLAQAQEFWRKWDGTSSTPAVENRPESGSRRHQRAPRSLWRRQARYREVVVYTIEGGGHTWPGGPQYLPVFLVGKASHNLDATETIWGFFKKHNR